MKKFLNIVVLLFFLIQVIPTFAQTDDFINSEKIHIQPENIFLSPHGILVISSEGIVSVPGIMNDNEGLYYDAVRWDWKCPFCGHVNAWYKNRCESCGRRPGDSN